MLSARPKWWQLYAWFGLLVVLFLMETRLPLSPGGHQTIQIGIVLVIFGLIFAWLRVNEVALIQADRKPKTEQGRVAEIRHALPPAVLAEAEVEAGNGDRPMFRLPESELKNTLESMPGSAEGVSRTGCAQ